MEYCFGEWVVYRKKKKNALSRSLCFSLGGFGVMLRCVCL